MQMRVLSAHVTTRPLTVVNKSSQELSLSRLSAVPRKKMQSPLTSVHAGPDPDYKPEKVFGKVIKPNAYAPCQKVYDEYYSCIFVEEASYGKFIGKCNHFKRALDECNIINRELARKANLEKAREKKRLMQEIDAKLQREEAAAASKAAEPPKKAWYKIW